MVSHKCLTCFAPQLEGECHSPASFLLPAKLRINTDIQYLEKNIAEKESKRM